MGPSTNVTTVRILIVVVRMAPMRVIMMVRYVGFYLCFAMLGRADLCWVLVLVKATGW